MDDIPSEQLFGHLPEETREAGGLEGRLKLDFSIGKDLINQKKQAEGEEKRDEVFQNELNRRFDPPESLEGGPLDVTRRRGEGHAHQEKKSGQKDHHEVDALSPQHASSLFPLKDNIQSRS